MRVDLDADSSPVVLAKVKALIWRIIQDSKGGLNSPLQHIGCHWVGGGGCRGGQGEV